VTPAGNKTRQQAQVLEFFVRQSAGLIVSFHGKTIHYS
jgi:hypothetical protein